MGIQAMIGRATADDLESKPAIKPDEVLHHLGGVE
jgi:hypothetical protein